MQRIVIFWGSIFGGLWQLPYGFHGERARSLGVGIRAEGN